MEIKNSSYHAGYDSKSMVYLNGGVLEVGSGGIYGNSGVFQLGGGTLRMVENNSVAAGRSTELSAGTVSTIDILSGVTTTWNGLFTGSGEAVKKGEGVLVLSGNYDANASAQFTGMLSVSEGVVRLNHASGLGSNGRINALKGGTIDANRLEMTQANLVLSGGTLVNADMFNGTLIVKGTSGKDVSTISGNAKLNELQLGEAFTPLDAYARLHVTGDLTILNGGTFYVDKNNQNQALVTIGGEATLSGEFALEFNTNMASDRYSFTYKLFNGKINNKSTAVVSVDPQLKEFFTADTSRFVHEGIVTVNRAEMVNYLITTPDVSEGGKYFNGFNFIDNTTYLGAKTGTVYFDREYTLYDGAMRLTNGTGWLNMASAVGGGNKIVIADYMGSDKVADSGVILSNNNNTYSGGTEILNVHVKVDGSLHADGITSGVSQILGTGAVRLWGESAHLNLATGGVGNTDTFSYNNTLFLNDGAQLSQTGSKNIWNGAVHIKNEATITNLTTQDFVFTSKISGRNLQLNGSMLLEGKSASMELNKMTLSGDSTLKLNAGAQTLIKDLQFNNSSVAVAGGSILGVGNLGGAGTISLSDGSTLKAYSNITLNKDGLAQLKSLTDDNILDTNGYLITLGKVDANLGQNLVLKGAGTVLISEDASQYEGTFNLGEGKVTLKIADHVTYSGRVEASSGSTFETGNHVTLGASSFLNLQQSAKAQLGDHNVVLGAVDVQSGAYLTVGNDGVFANDLHFSSMSKSVFGERTDIQGKNLTIDQGASVHFGLGSKTSSVMDQVVTVDGSLGGFLMMEKENSIHFGSESRYLISAEDLTKYEVEGNGESASYAVAQIIDGQSKLELIKTPGVEGQKAAIHATGSLTLDVTSSNYKRFAIDRTITDQLLNSGVFSLMHTEDEKGIQIQQGSSTASLTSDNWDLRHFQLENGDVVDMLDLGGQKYAWLSFELMGHSSTGSHIADTINLNVIRNVRYDLLALNSNELAIAHTLTTVGQLAGSKALDGELNKLGASLAMATERQVNGILTSLTDSATSTLNGYTAQLINLRSHNLDIRNRAVQESPAALGKYGKASEGSFWASGEGSTYSISNNNDACGFTSNLWGGSFGATKAFSPNLVGGLSFTYTSADISNDGGYGNATHDAYYIDLFARYSKNNWNVTTVLTGGITDLDSTRHTNVQMENFYNTTTKGSTSGNQVMGLVEVGYEFAIDNNKNEVIEPFALLSVGYSSLDGYSETGAGNAGYQMDSQNKTLVSLGAGLRYVNHYMTEYSTTNPGRFELRAMVLQDLTDPQVTVEGRYIGSADTKFAVDSATPGKSAFYLGAGIVQPISENVSVFGDVSGEFRSGSTGAGLNIGVKYHF